MSRPDFGDEIAALRSEPPELNDVDFDALRRQIRQRVAEERRPARWWIPIPLFAAAAALLLAVLWFRPQPLPPPPPVAQAHVPAASPLLGTHGGPPEHRRPKPPVPRPDPALEAALQRFLTAEAAAQSEPVPPPPGQIRIVGSDPNIILILIPGDGAFYD